MNESAELIGQRLLKAIREGDLARCRSLILTGAKLSAPDDKGWMPLHVAALEETPEITRLLLEAGAPVNAHTTDKGTWTALHIAGSYSHTKTMEELLKKGADVNAQAARQWTPLHVAAWCGRGDAVALLLDHGADTNALTDKSRTAAFWAEHKGHEDVVLEIGKAVSLRHAERVRALKILRDRKRDG